VLAGRGPWGGAAHLAEFWAAPASIFHKIPTGATRGPPAYSAAPGYDLVTGLGSPFSDSLIKDLLA